MSHLAEMQRPPLRRRQASQLRKGCTGQAEVHIVQNPTPADFAPDHGRLQSFGFGGHCADRQHCCVQLQTWPDFAVRPEQTDTLHACACSSGMGIHSQILKQASCGFGSVSGRVHMGCCSCSSPSYIGSRWMQRGPRPGFQTPSEGLISIGRKIMTCATG